jgi:hypothetical protein
MLGEPCAPNLGVSLFSKVNPCVWLAGSTPGGVLPVRQAFAELDGSLDCAFLALDRKRYSL